MRTSSKQSRSQYVFQGFGLRNAKYAVRHFHAGLPFFPLTYANEWRVCDASSTNKGARNLKRDHEDGVWCASVRREFQRAVRYSCHKQGAPANGKRSPLSFSSNPSSLKSSISFRMRKHRENENSLPISKVIALAIAFFLPIPSPVERSWFFSPFFVRTAIL